MRQSPPGPDESRNRSGGATSSGGDQDKTGPALDNRGDDLFCIEYLGQTRAGNVIRFNALYLDCGDSGPVAEEPPPVIFEFPLAPLAPVRRQRDLSCRSRPANHVNGFASSQPWLSRWRLALSP